MATVAATTENFNSLVAAHDVTVVDFWASWCGPCRVFAPVFEEVSAAFPDVTFAKVDTEAETELAGAFAIMSIPTLMVIRDGVVVFSQAGALPAAALTELMGAVLALDMDDVRRQMAEAAS